METNEHNNEVKDNNDENFKCVIGTIIIQKNLFLSLTVISSTVGDAAVGLLFFFESCNSLRFIGKIREDKVADGLE